MKKSIWIHAGIVLAMFAAACIYMAPALSGKIIRQGDIQKSDAMSYEQREAKKTLGHTPNWASSMFSGMPGYQIATEPQHSVFQPLRNVAIMRHVGLERNIGVIFLYLIGFYVALLAFGASPWVAAIGALAFGLGSYNIIIIEAGHITKAWAMSMMAPVLAGMFLVLRTATDPTTDKRQRNRRVLWGSLLFTLALILQISFNHIQITFYTAIGCVMLGLAYLVYAIAKRQIPSFMAKVGILIAGAALAFGCNARLLLVNEEYARYTMRGGNELTVTPADLGGDVAAAPSQSSAEGLDIDYAFNWSYGIGETYTLLVPGALGGGSYEMINPEKSEFYKAFRSQMPQYQYPWGDRAPLYWGSQPFTSGPVYFGAIVILLFLLGMVVVKGPERWWILASAVIAILLSWGGNLMGLNGWLFDHVPLYNKFRTPSMALVLANACMVILAALALKRVFSANIDEAGRKRINMGLYLSAGVLTVAILGVMLASGGFAFASQSDSQLPPQLTDALIKDRASLLKADSWRSLLFILLTAAVIWLYNNQKIKKAGIALALVGAMVVIDLWGVDRRYLNKDNFVEAKSVELRRKQYDYDIDQLAAQYGDQNYRVLNLAVNTFNDSEPSAFHHQIGGYSAAKLSRYQNLIDFYLSRRIKPEVLNMLNARYIVTQDGKVQRNPEALGNAWFVSSVRMVGDANGEILALNTINPKNTAVVNWADEKKLGTIGKSVVIEDDTVFTLAFDSTATIVMEHQKPYNPDYLKYTTHTTSDQLAVFSEIHYAPDWRAYIDGKPAEYLRANYVLRAMVIPAGDHVIEFRNEAPRMRKLDNITLAISIITLLGMVGAVVWVYRRRRE